MNRRKQFFIAAAMALITPTISFVAHSAEPASDQISQLKKSVAALTVDYRSGTINRDLMTNLNKVEFYNVGALEKTPALDGVALKRVPAEVRNTLNKRGRYVAATSNGAEVRFVAGIEVLDDFSGLSADLLHPCAYGNAVMGINLASILEKIVP